MTSTEIVGPVVYFRGDRLPNKVLRGRVSVLVDRAPPTDTRDPRYIACTDHHLACDCREAEQNEEIREWLGNWQAARDAAQEICGGHPTWPDYFVEEHSGAYDVTYARSEDCCQCTGCQIIRKAHL